MSGFGGPTGAAKRWPAQAAVATLQEARPLTGVLGASGLDLPTQVRAASGLCRWGEHWVVAQDDVNALALIHGESGAITPLVLPAGPGGRRQFSEDAGNKADKLDLEACLVLPDGRLLALGSGSTAARERLVVATAAGEVRVVDGAALYAGLRQRRDFAGAALNLEGAVVVGDRLLLFQRGNGRGVNGAAPVNAVGTLDLGAFLRWLDEGGAVPTLAAVQVVDLGRVGRVAFGFTDAAALPDGRVVFLAGAEDSPDTYHDGAVLGARVGLLEGDRITWAEVVEAGGQRSRLKLEGVAWEGFSPEGGLVLRVVADPDDTQVPATWARLVWALA